MKTLTKQYLFLFISVLPLVLVSCTLDSCFEETTPFLNASFYKKGSNIATTPDSITIYGVGNESIMIYNRALKVSRIKLPLNPSAQECGFIMKIDTITDTLTFKYSSYPHLISKECGISFFHILESYKVSGTATDTIIFRNKNITTSYEENIRIFY